MFRLFAWPWPKVYSAHIPKNMLTIFLLHILGYDIWFYLSHRLLHTPLLWPYHALHHAYRHPTFAETYAGHALEGPFQSIGFLLPYVWFDPNIAAAAAAAVLVNVRGMMRHDARAIWLIGNHHLLHHEVGTKNFGEFWIDSLCGTAIDDATRVKKGWIRV